VKKATNSTAESWWVANDWGMDARTAALTTKASNVKCHKHI